MERSFHRILVKHIIADRETFDEAPFFHEGVFFVFSARSRAEIIPSSWEKKETRLNESFSMLAQYIWINDSPLSIIDDVWPRNYSR